MPHERALIEANVDPLQRAQWRDRLVVVAALFTVAALTWYFTAAMAYDMESMLLPQGYRWSGVEIVMLFVMWVVMMIAMMLPSATPAVLLFSRMRRTQTAQAAAMPHTAWFVLGYLAAWSIFSVAATLLQWILHGAGLLSPTMTSNSARLGAVLLLLAGVFQLSSLKHACLSHCRSPLGFIMSHWREGARGAFSMGWRHGLYCVGCCWALMVLLFVTGVMNLLWIALISVFVLAEKVVPAGQFVARASGIVLIVTALWMLFQNAVTVPGV